MMMSNIWCKKMVHHVGKSSHMPKNNKFMWLPMVNTTVFGGFFCGFQRQMVTDSRKMVMTWGAIWRCHPREDGDRFDHFIIKNVITMMNHDDNDEISIFRHCGCSLSMDFHDDNDDKYDVISG